MLTRLLGQANLDKTTLPAKKERAKNNPISFFSYIPWQLTYRRCKTLTI